MNTCAALRLVKYWPFAATQSFCVPAMATNLSRYGWAKDWLPTPCSLSTTMVTPGPSVCADAAAMPRRVARVAANKL